MVQWLAGGSGSAKLSPASVTVRTVAVIVAATLVTISVSADTRSQQSVGRAPQRVAIAHRAASSSTSIRPNTRPASYQPTVCSMTSDRRPVAVILDNFGPDARPQSGLTQASFVYETLVEGGITRLMAVYLGRDAPTVGPVRSTRLYFNSWAAGLGAILAHDGGNVDAQQQLRSLTSVFNVDADRSARPFWRAPTRFSPHNEYTSTDGVRAFVRQHAGAVDGRPLLWPRKPDALLWHHPAPFSVTIPFSTNEYNVTWRYNPAANYFVRIIDGRPQVDLLTRHQVTANNVVVMQSDETPSYDPFTPGAIHMRTEGTGRATVYEDGHAVPATWSKPTIGSPLHWLDRHGRPISLDCGTTWIEVISTGR